tara:strand:- start:1783 stop:2157 length:375 start_codon:yes stop_codon:yes gene_type:complete
MKILITLLILFWSSSVYALTVTFLCKFSNVDVHFKVDDKSLVLLTKSTFTDFKWIVAETYTLSHINKDDKEVILKIRDEVTLPTSGKTVNRIFMKYGPSPGYYESFVYSTSHSARGNMQCNFLG